MASEQHVIGRIDGENRDRDPRLWVGVDETNKWGVITLGTIGSPVLIEVQGLSARQCGELSAMLSEAADRIDPSWIEKL